MTILVILLAIAAALYLTRKSWLPVKDAPTGPIVDDGEPIDINDRR